MEPKYKDSHYTHVIRIVLGMVAIAVFGMLIRPLVLPRSFGEYGHYRPGAVEDETNRPMRNMTNESCMDCHKNIKKIHRKGVHESVSCEVCHASYADHIQDGEYYAPMPVVRGEDIKALCLRCHNKIIRARPPESIKMIALPEHLEEQNVGTHHVCNQCHHVHAPLKWVKEAREMMGLSEKDEDKPAWMN